MVYYLLLYSLNIYLNSGIYCNIILIKIYNVVPKMFEIIIICKYCDFMFI